VFRNSVGFGRFFWPIFSDDFLDDFSGRRPPIARSSGSDAAKLPQHCREIPTKLPQDAPEMSWKLPKLLEGVNFSKEM
jgi:hypothetical protein